MNTVEALRLGKIDDLCAEYEERGFSIIRDPGQEHVPFDLDLLSPDLLASGPDENVLIFVRESAEWVSMQRLRELMQEVRRYPDWDLLLVTADDIPLVGRAGENVLPSWPELRAQASRAIAFVLSGAEADAAFLVLWAA
ncbi:MAG TPA: hypothetical protein VJT67_13865, partial [Longimicrobiaceae bacterium]|nr:hypothetical protein [Longimicrobiaceae bacterium]